MSATPDGEGGPFRLLVDGARDGAENMAVDEAILERYAGCDPPDGPTLRIYGWAPAALSLGRNQPAAGAHDAAFLRAEKIDLVRRPTGGRAVLHDRERTYAVVAALGRPPFSGGVVATYERIASALAAGLRALGLDPEIVPSRPEAADPGPVGSPVCFERPGASEIAAAGLKLVGSAQLRRRGAFLQHGSIPIHVDAARLAGAIGVVVDPRGFTDLESALGGSVDASTLDRALAGGFAEVFGVPVVRGTLTPAEAARAAQLRCWKYDSAAWTLEGRIGARERRWGPPPGGPEGDD